MLLDSSNQTKYFIRLPGGQEIGPYATEVQARMSLATMPVIEEGGAAIIVPKTAGGAEVLFG